MSCYCCTDFVARIFHVHIIVPSLGYSKQGMAAYYVIELSDNFLIDCKIESPCRSRNSSLRQRGFELIDHDTIISPSVRSN